MMNDEFESRLSEVMSRVKAACNRADRDDSEVSVVAVAKKHSPAEVALAADLGLSVIGENRIQEAKAKIPLCSDSLEWHLIGHLQSNKVKDAVRLFSMIHSIDTVKILEAVNHECGSAGKVMPVCLQVNVSGEGSKYGFAPEDIPKVLQKCESLMNVDVTGLMTIPPFAPDPEDSRHHFAKLRSFRDGWRDSCGFDLPELSMGMSGDFGVAIEEGATMIRVGSTLFGKR